MLEVSAHIKAQLRSEFQKLFETLDYLPPWYSIPLGESQGWPGARCQISANERAATNFQGRNE